MPPMAVATTAPAGNSPPGADSTVPAASMPSTRGNRTPGEWPWGVNISDRFSPNARTRISTCPGPGTGTGRVSTLSTSGPPGS